MAELHIQLKEAIEDEYEGDYLRASRFILIPDWILERIAEGEGKNIFFRDREKIEDYLAKYNNKKEKE